MFPRELDAVATFTFLTFNGDVTSDGSSGTTIRHQWDDLLRSVKRERGWVSYWGKVVGRTNEIILITVHVLAFQRTDIDRRTDDQMFIDDMARRRGYLVALDEYLTTPVRSQSVLLDRDETHLLAWSHGQAMTLCIADVNNDKCPFLRFDIRSSTARGEKKRFSERSELLRFQTGQTISPSPDRSQPAERDKGRYICIAEWPSVEAMYVFQDSSRSSVRPWAADDAWEQHFVRPLQKLQSEGVITEWESWAIDLRHSDTTTWNPYEIMKREQAAKEAREAERAKKRGFSCCAVQ